MTLQRKQKPIHLSLKSLDATASVKSSLNVIRWGGPTETWMFPKDGAMFKSSFFFHIGLIGYYHKNKQHSPSLQLVAWVGVWAGTQYHTLHRHSLLHRLWAWMTSPGQDHSACIWDIRVYIYEGHVIYPWCRVFRLLFWCKYRSMWVCNSSHPLFNHIFKEAIIAISTLFCCAYLYVFELL